MKQGKTKKKKEKEKKKQNNMAKRLNDKKSFYGERII